MNRRKQQLQKEAEEHMTSTSSGNSNKDQEAEKKAIRGIGCGFRRDARKVH